jgi:hypothetical protein
MKIIYEQDDHVHVAVMALKGEPTPEIAKKHVPAGKRFKLVADDAVPETHDFTNNDGTGERA